MIWTQSLRKELAEKIKETQVDLQAVKTSFDTRTKDLLQTATNKREPMHTLLDLFHSEDDGPTKKLYHRIDTGDALPIRQPPEAAAPSKQAEISEMLDDMQRRGIIEESDSPWLSPVLLVRKKNLDLLFCLYYRTLNDVTKKDCFPPPRIDDTLDTLAGAKWFSTLYLTSGYWQVDINTDDREKLHSPQVRVYGISQSRPLASAMFRRHLRGRSRLLRGLTYESCLVYLDDVIVIGRMFQEHLLNLRKLFERFREARLKLNPEVSSFAEGSTVPRSYCVSCRNIYRPRKSESCSGMANSEE
jgi:hypothetical protein